MDCATTELLLIDYHFAVAAQAQRDAVHAHLRDCQACARQYLDFKHAVDSGAALAVRPSAATRARLRAEVRALFRPSLAARARQWLARPVPRYQVAAVACALVLLMTGLLAGLRSQPGSGVPVLANRQDALDPRQLSRQGPVLHRAYEAVDTARPMPVSLTYY